MATENTNMPGAYKHIAGTSKKAFKIGSKGITLTTIPGFDWNEEKTIKKLKVDNHVVQVEGQLVISKSCITEFIPSSDGKSFILSYKYYDSNNILQKDTVTVYTSRQDTAGTGDVKGPSTEVTEGNLVAFGNKNGKEIIDSGIKVVTSMNETDNATKTVPTVSLMKNFIDGITEPLEARRDGV